MREVLIVVGDATETLLLSVLPAPGGGPPPRRRRPRGPTLSHRAPRGAAGLGRDARDGGLHDRGEVAFRDVEPERFAGVYDSGGRAPEYPRYDDALLALTREFFALDRPVATVCHGVEIPARAGCLAGRRLTTVAKCRFDLEAVGAEYFDAPCVVDGNLVSGRTYHDHGAFVGPWIGLLGGVHGPGPTPAPPPA